MAKKTKNTNPQSFFSPDRKGNAAVNTPAVCSTGSMTVGMVEPSPIQTANDQALEEAQALEDQARHDAVEHALESLPIGAPLLAVIDPSRADTPPAADDYDFIAALAGSRDPETEIAMLQESNHELHDQLRLARQAHPTPEPTNPWLEAAGHVVLLGVGALLGGCLAVAGQEPPKPWYATLFS